MPLFGLDLANWWRIICQRKRIVLFIFFTIFFSTIFFTNHLSPVYLAQATVKVGWSKSMGEFILREDWGEGVDIDEEVRFIRSPQVREEVLKRLVPAPDEETSEEGEELSRALPGVISVRRVERSNLIEIEAAASRPEVAAELANTIAQVYVDLNLNKRAERTRAFRQRLEQELIISKSKLDDSEQALKDFKEREGNVVPEKERVQDRLVALELELSEQMLRYSTESPMVRELKGELAATRNELKELLSKELELKRLTRTFEYNQRKYEDWKEWISGLRITEQDEVPDVDIINPATVPESASAPNKLLNGFVGAVVGLLAGASFSFFMESLKTSLGSIEEVESFIKLPVLGVIPYLPVKKEKKKLDKITRLREQLIIHYSPQSSAAESYRSLRTSIKSLALDKQDTLLLVTSSGPGEGKSITCANLALTCVQAGLRVCLVGADLRRPILHKLFGLERGPGLADCLTGTTKWQDVLRSIVDILVGNPEWEGIIETPGLDNLKIITCGRLPLNPAELLDSPEAKSLAKELKANFDLVLFDSPPVLPIADAAILGPKLNGVILVYQTARVAGEALRRAREQLETVGSSIKGIVLNNTTRELEAYPPYRYYRDKYY